MKNKLYSAEEFGLQMENTIKDYIKDLSDDDLKNLYDTIFDAFDFSNMIECIVEKEFIERGI